MWNLGFTGEQNIRLLKSMCNRLVHRSPDEERYYCDGEMNLGIRRLAIVDIEYGNQPIYNEEKDVVLVFNGEIYNHIELRKKWKKKDTNLGAIIATQTL